VAYRLNFPETWFPIEHSVFRLRDIAYRRIEEGASLSADGRYNRLILVVSGEGGLESGVRRQWLRRGSWVVCGPQTAYELHVPEGVALVYYEATFAVWTDTKASAESRYAIRHDESAVWCGESGYADVLLLHNQARQLFLERSESDDLTRFRHQYRFQEMMYWLIRSELPRDQVDGIEAIARVMDYMDNHYQEPLSRQRLAHLAGMSEAYFSRKFKRVTGQSPHAFLNTLRVDHAKRELLAGRGSMEEIALRTGFEEGYYFSRKFKQTVGLSPTAYARQQNNKIACVFFPYADPLLTLGLAPYATAMPEDHPLSPRTKTSINLGDMDLEFNNRAVARLSAAQPELILASYDLESEQEAKLGVIAPLLQVVWNHEWRMALRKIAEHTGYQLEAERAIAAYEQHREEASAILRERLGVQSIAIVRLRDQEIRLYGGPSRGYTGPVLYGDLGLHAPALVRSIAWGAGAVNLRLEDLAALDAEWLLLVIDPDAEAYADSVMRSQVWRAMPATQKGRLHRVGYYTWMSTGNLMNRLKIEELLRVTDERGHNRANR